MPNRLLLLAALLAMSRTASAQTDRSLPAKVNLGPEFQKLHLSPRAQGRRDTCSLFALTAVANFEYAKNARPPHKRLSEEFLIWAANEATGREGDQAMFCEAVHGLNALGICTEVLMPYANASDAGRKPSTAALADAKERSARWKIHWIKRWDLKRPLRDEQLGAIKEALANGHPVACGLRWPKSVRGSEILEVPPPDNVFDGHSIVFTGYQEDARWNGGGVFFFRNSAGPRWGSKGYGILSYAYARAYANDALWLQFGSPNSEKPTQRLEAESLTVLAQERCEISPQDMAKAFGLMWSQGKQLFCAAREGGSVRLGFPVEEAGRYRLRILATAAPDFGSLRVTLDGKALDADFDLYSGRVCPSGPLELGTHVLAARRHTLTFTVVGKNTASTGFFFGLDAIDLMAVK